MYILYLQPVPLICIVDVLYMYILYLQSVPLICIVDVLYMYILYLQSVPLICVVDVLYMYMLYLQSVPLIHLSPLRSNTALAASMSECLLLLSRNPEWKPTVTKRITDTLSSTADTPNLSMVFGLLVLAGFPKVKC